MSRPMLSKGPNSHHFDADIHFLWKLANKCQKKTQNRHSKAQIEAEDDMSTPMLSQSPNSHHVDAGVHFLWKLANKCQKTPKMDIKLYLKKVSTPILSSRSQIQIILMMVSIFYEKWQTNVKEHHKWTFLGSNWSWEWDECPHVI